jgi:hypothetical protein
VLYRLLWPLVPDQHIHYLEHHYLIDVSHCTNVHRLRLFDIRSNDSVSLSSPSSDVWQILSQISSHKVEDLIIEFSKPNGIQFDWHCLADVLARPTFASLRTIRIESTLDTGSELSEVEAWQRAEKSIRQHALSTFDRHGILDIHLTQN